MKVLFSSALAFTFILSVSSFHLRQPDPAPDPSSDSDADSNSTSVKNSNVENSSSNSSSDLNFKGNLNTLLPNPTVITNQIQSLIQKLNSTISSFTSNSTNGLSSIIGTVKNLTSSLTNKSRSEDVDRLAANISQILRSETETSLANSSSILPAEVEGALRDFKKELRSAFNIPSQNASESSLERRNGENVIPDERNQKKGSSNASANGEVSGRGRRKDGFEGFLDKMAQVDSKIQKSLSDARSRLEDSITTTAKQGSQLMRNQTMGFMTEIRRVFSSFSEPFRQFMEDVRKRVPTAVITA